MIVKKLKFTTMKHLLHLLFCLIVLPMMVTAQNNKNPESLISRFLNNEQLLNKSAGNIEFEIVSSSYEKATQIGKVQALQNINGVTIHDAIVTMAYNKDGKTFGTSTFTSTKPNVTSPIVAKSKAIALAAKYHDLQTPKKLLVSKNSQLKDEHTIYEGGTLYSADPEVRLVYLQNDTKDQLTLTWQTQLYTRDMQHYFVDYIDATTGEVLRSEDKVIRCEFDHGLAYDASTEEQEMLDKKRQEMHLESAERWRNNSETSHSHSHNNCSHTAMATTSVTAPANKYLVLDLPAEAPNDDSANSEQTVVTTAGDPIASPYGWTSLNGDVQLPYTHGNNVFAFYDPSPGPLGGVPNPATAAQATSNNVLGAQEFIYHWDLTQDPEYVQPSSNNAMPNRNAAIVNLFYHNNLVHDIFYNFGFDEEGRNFQFENFDRGGLGNDNVLAQAQDGGGTNNANMLTLQDGVNPQMQMYLWTQAGRDELVKVTSVSQDAHVAAGDEFIAIQGAIYSAATPYDLHENPVLDKNFVLINDGCGSPTGCGLGGGVGSAPCNSVVDAIVLIDRGDCSFVEKVDGAQKGGAAGVIIMNNNSSSPDEVAAMGGTDPTGNTITIPSVMVSFNTGLLLKESLADGATIVGSLQQINPPAPRKDGDFDNGIIAHEYGHGISSRTSPQGLIGGTLSGSEQGGEGWSDYYALYLTTTSSDLSAANDLHPNGTLPDKGIGTYVTYTDSDGPGIRPRRYSVDMDVNEYTFAGTTNGGIGIGNSAEITVPHGVGFIWCTMLWEMTQNLVDEYGYNDEITYNPPSNDIQAIVDNTAGNNLALKLIQEGISLQKPSPTFLDMRDAIILADELHYDGAHSCLIWKAFAKRGLGSDAINPTNNIGDERDGYATPCDPAQAFHNITIDAPSLIENESNMTYTITIDNTSDATSYNVITTDVIPEDFTITSIEGADHEIEGRKITFDIDEIAANTSVDLTVSGYVLTDDFSEIKNTYSFEDGSEGWTAVTGGANTFTRMTDGGQDGAAYFHADNNGLTGANTMLESPAIPITGVQRQIRFYHKYDTDAPYDGGYLEYSDDGVTWLPLTIQQNGYNTTLNGLFNLTYTGPAYSGSIASYIESAALLPATATKVRFVFAEDSGLGGGEGWDIDNIRIVNNPTSLHNAGTVTDPIESGARVYVDEVFTLVTGSTRPSFDVKPSMSVTPGVVNDGEGPMRVLVDVLEMSGNGSSGPVTVRTSKNDYLGFTFDPSLTEVGGYAVDNDLFKFTENFLFWEFTTSEDISSNLPLRFGFIGNFDSAGTGDMPVSAKTKTVSKLENNSTNDKDNETINYSDQN